MLDWAHGRPPSMKSKIMLNPICHEHLSVAIFNPYHRLVVIKGGTEKEQSYYSDIDACFGLSELHNGCYSCSYRTNEKKIMYPPPKKKKKKKKKKKEKEKREREKIALK